MFLLFSICRNTYDLGNIDYPALEGLVHLPEKHVWDKIAGKEKAVPKEAFLAPLLTAFSMSFIISELKKVVKW